MRTRRRKLCMGMLLLALAGGSYFFWIRWTGLAIPCLFRIMTGWYCPSCGVTRMLFALLQLRLADAYAANPLLLLLLPWIAAEIVLQMKRYLTEHPKPMGKVHRIALNVLVGVLLVYGVLRNFPIFSFLQPR